MLKPATSLIRHANELRKTSRNKQAILAEVKDVLAAMYDNMVEANKEGRNSITIAVPKFFSSVGSDEDTILQITTTILRELVDADYDVTVTPTANTNIFEIRWDTDLSYGDKKSMTDYLRKYTAEPQPDGSGSAPPDAVARRSGRARA